MKKFIAIALFAVISFQVFGQKDYKQSGNASVIDDKFVGRYTANGEKYAHNKLTAAHLTLPFGTMVKVTNLENKKSVVVRINDRGPFAEDRIIDLSKSASGQIGFINGVKKVMIEVVDQSVASATEKTEKKPVVSTKSEEIVQTRESAFFKISSQNVTPTGFGVQIASYKEPSNLLRLAEQIKTESGHNPVLEIAENNNGTTFRLIIGEFKTRKEAERVQKTLSSAYPKCFVITF